MAIETPSVFLPPVNLSTLLSTDGGGSPDPAGSPFLNLLLVLIGQQGIQGGTGNSSGLPGNLVQIAPNRSAFLSEAVTLQTPEDEKPENVEGEIPGFGPEWRTVLASCLQLPQFSQAVLLQEHTLSSVKGEPVIPVKLIQAFLLQDGISSTGGPVLRAAPQSGFNPESGWFPGTETGPEEAGHGSSSTGTCQSVNHKLPEASKDVLNMLSNMKAERPENGQPVSPKEQGLPLTAGKVVAEPVEQAVQAKAFRPEPGSLPSRTAGEDTGNRKAEPLSPVFSETFFEEGMGQQASKKDGTTRALETKALLNRDNSLQDIFRTAPALREAQFNFHLQPEPGNGEPGKPEGIMKQIAEQVVERAHLAVGKEATILKIHLKPEFLGKLDLVISLEKGVLQARFLAENPVVANLIETRLPELRQSLEQHGISWQQVSVAVDSQTNFQEFSQTHQEAQTPQHNLPCADALEDVPARGENSKAESASRGVPGLVDYLV